MKKSKFLMFAAIACSSFFIASCSNDIESNGNGTQGDDATFDVQVVDENPDTRLFLGADKYNHFQTNDEVAVWSKDNATRVKFACTASGTTATIKKASGETNVLGNSTKYFAAYPYAAINSNNKTESNLVQMKYTTDQTYTEAELQTKYKPILVGGTDDSQKHLKLYNASAMLKVTFTNNSEETINSVDVNTNGAACITNVTNTWSANYSGNTITGISNAGVYDAGSCSSQRVKPVTIAPNASVTIYFMLPIQSTGYTSSKYSFSAYESADGTGTALVTKTLKSALTIERNKIYNLGTIEIGYPQTDPVNFKTSYKASDYYAWDAYSPFQYFTFSGSITQAGTWAPGSAWYNPTNTLSETAASQSCKNCATHNQVAMYLAAGAYWDNGASGANQKTFTLPDGNTYHTGFWLVKKRYISGFDDGTATKSEKVSNLKYGRPAAGVINKYFFLPCTGYYGGYTDGATNHFHPQQTDGDATTNGYSFMYWTRSTSASAGYHTYVFTNVGYQWSYNELSVVDKQNRFDGCVGFYVE